MLRSTAELDRRSVGQIGTLELQAQGVAHDHEACVRPRRDLKAVRRQGVCGARLIRAGEHTRDLLGNDRRREVETLAGAYADRTKPRDLVGELDALRDHLQAERVAEGDDRARIIWAWQQCTSRLPDDNEVAILTELLQQNRARYAADEAAARRLAAVGQMAWPEDLSLAELATWTAVSRAILNVHECVARN